MRAGARRLSRAASAALCACATARGEADLSPAYAELAPRRVGVLVAAVAEPTDARGAGGRFLAPAPGRIVPDTPIPRDGPRARAISDALAGALVARLRARGYDAARVEPAPARVADALDAARCDAVLAVLYTPVERWSVSELEGVTVQRVGETQQETRRYRSADETGLLVWPSAALIDARTTHRMWSRRLQPPRDGRLDAGGDLRRMGVAGGGPDGALPVERAARAAIEAFFAPLPAAAPGRPVPPERLAALRGSAETDRWRHEGRLLLDVAPLLARRPFDVDVVLGDGGSGHGTLDAGAAYGAMPGVEVALRWLGREWAHGPFLAVAADGADVSRTVAGPKPGGAGGTLFRSATVRVTSAAAAEAGWSLARAWQPRRRLLLLGGARFSVGTFLIGAEATGGSFDRDLRLPLAAEAAAEALWAGETLLFGPFARGGVSRDLARGTAGPTFTAGLRAGVSWR